MKYASVFWLFFFLSVFKTFFLGGRQAHEFPWEAYLKILIRMLLINFIITELAKLAAFSQPFFSCSFPNDFIEF